MIVMYKMTPEKKEKYTHKIEKMIDFLEEFKECLEESEYSDEEPEYRGSRMYRTAYHEDEMMHPSRYTYRKGRM